jgi:hypothetical protein
VIFKALALQESVPDSQLFKFEIIMDRGILFEAILFEAALHH